MCPASITYGPGSREGVLRASEPEGLAHQIALADSGVSDVGIPYNALPWDAFVREGDPVVEIGFVERDRSSRLVDQVGAEALHADVASRKADIEERPVEDQARLEHNSLRLEHPGFHRRFG